MNNSQFLKELNERRKLKKVTHLEVINETFELSPDPLEPCYFNFINNKQIEDSQKAQINQLHSIFENKGSPKISKSNQEEIKEKKNFQKSPQPNKYKKMSGCMLINCSQDKNVSNLLEDNTIVEKKSENKNKHEENKEINIKQFFYQENMNKNSINISQKRKEENNENLDNEELFRNANNSIVEKNVYSRNIFSRLNFKKKDQKSLQKKCEEEV